MSKAAAKTGSGPIATVAIEQLFPIDQRIIRDDYAYPILPFGVRAYAWLARADWLRDWMIRASEKAVPGAWSGFLCRKRYIGDKLTEAIDNISSVVILGAGFDTLAYRHPALANVQVWEVDQPVNIKGKRAQLRKLFGKVPAHAKLVPIDFDHEDLGAVLTSHGYSLSNSTFFVWEAVTQYLTETGIRGTLDFLAKAPAGSRLVFTYVLKDLIDGKEFYGHEYIYKKTVLKDKSWLYGIDPEEVSKLLGRYGWRVLEHLGYDELAERYVKPTGRKLPSMAIERIVYAEKE